MREAMPGLPVQPYQVLPHGDKSFDVGFRIWRLRTEMNLNARQIDKIRFFERPQHHLACLSGGDAEFRSIERSLKPCQRTSPYTCHQSDSDICATSQFRCYLLNQFKFESGVDIERVYACYNRLGNFAFGLRDAVDLNLARPESRPQCLK